MKTLIIAEAGVNHNGDLELAKKMAVVAKNAGADIVKYQTAVPELVISKFAEKADYQKTNTGDFSTMLSELQNAELKAYMETQDTEEFFFSIARATSHEQLTRKGSDSEGAVVDVTEIAALGEPYPTYSSPYMLYYEWLNSNGFIKKD